MNSSDLQNLSEAERRARVAEALARGEELRKAKEYDKGIDVLVEALRYGVEKAKIYFRLGNIYFDAGKLDHAEYAYRRAIDCDPNHVNAHHNLSVVLRKQGRLSESVRLYRQAQRLAMKYPDQVQLSPEQTEQARRLARRWLIVAGIVLGVFVLVLVLWGR
ncbi:MAG: tetratricopeptide repeat protein [Candidatus Bipolaricaulota bacterium]|nr:tetratricopeptide repeat protein [Candidatus Bipolaricaulota bacterium]MCS7274027.1 tetratricopeptide repeat protein [Candidatus Bipolaricaulota bacterium]MDW8110227.1 tetratricopeptide repeat protein [Candidatus Bipolaricaulota bacterium]MDW8328873.1 tetratricopeptide repeat protein [Candidatus Bipolaricaulota bacterium]